MAADTKKIPIVSANPSTIGQFDIISNKTQKSVSLLNGILEMNYHENILDSTVRISVEYADTGSVTASTDGKSVLEGLPLVGSEKVSIKFQDNNDVTIGDDPIMDLYVNTVTPLYKDTTRSLVNLSLVSKEYLLNEKVRLNTRFDGVISEHVKGILTNMEFDKDGKKVQKNYLNTEKDIDVEDSVGEYNFCGNNKKPFYTMNWLSKKAVPDKGNPKALGNSAGYFLWETSDGFNFRSIDWLMNKDENKKKKSIIYNDTPAGHCHVPEGYDIKALAAEKDNRVNVQEKLKMGAYSTRTIMFNPFNCLYEVVTPDAYGKGDVPANQDKLTKAGEKLPVLNDEFNMNKREGGDGEGIPASSGKKDEKVSDSKEFSRTQFMLIDSGTLIANGSKDPKKWNEGCKKQLEGCQKEQNFDIKEILSQSSMRYNQLFSTKISVTIPGEFSLRAGDSIFFDGPELTGDANKDEIDEKDGGLYIIADLCHYSSSKETYTKINLVRDSTERKGSPSGG